MDSISNKIIELRIATRKICRCEDGNKTQLSLRTKLIFLISKKSALTPQELISELCINKCNLASLARSAEQDGLIERSRDEIDAREVSYSITDAGRAYLEKRLKILDEAFKDVFETSQDRNKAIEEIDSILHTLSLANIE